MSRFIAMVSDPGWADHSDARRCAAPQVSIQPRCWWSAPLAPRHRLHDIYEPGFTQADYPHARNAGHETGYLDERGVAAPGPKANPKLPTIADPCPPSQEQALLNPDSRTINGHTISGDSTSISTSCG